MVQIGGADGWLALVYRLDSFNYFPNLVYSERRA